MTTPLAAADSSPRSAPRLVDRFDALLFDLDGVVYIGPAAVPHAADVIGAVRAAGRRCVFVTNNAARSPADVAKHLASLAIPADVGDVVTSPQAAVTVLGQYVPEGSRVLVIGGVGITDALEARGFVPVAGLADDPAAVMQGYSPDLSWRDLAEACFAVRSGLPWIATNADLTIPTPRGVAPGNGTLVAIVARTVGREPDAIAGKPEPPLLLEAIARASAGHPLMIGDRLDTDIAAGARVGIPSLLVFTGVTTIAEVVAAIPEERPSYLGYDLRVLLEPYPTVEVTDERADCGDVVVRLRAGRITVDGLSAADPWDALRATAALAWRCADRGRPVDASGAIEAVSAALT